MSRNKDHNAVAIIPARLGSTRFPRKALADETGKPMVVHVCERAAKAETVSRVVVATDAEEIKSAVELHGFEAVMTSVEHTNGTSRLGEAATTLNLPAQQIVINVQGDEPEIKPRTIEAAFVSLCSSEGPADNSIGTVVCPINNKQDFDDPNVVKAVMSDFGIDRSARTGTHESIQIGKALYFSRSSVPYPRVETHRSAFRHVGIYAYKVESIHEYLSWDPSSLEVSESLEQLRWFDHDYSIFAGFLNTPHSGIDTPEQYQAFVNRYRTTQGK